MNLLDINGDVVQNATEIIDSQLPIIDTTTEKFNSVDTISCEPSVLDNKIIQSLSNIVSADKDNIANLSTYDPKVYGIQSRKLADLDPSFNPIAECIIAFIDQWCQNGGASIGSEVLSTWVLDIGWSGSPLVGFNHAVGSLKPIKETTSYNIDDTYLIKYTIINRTSGSINISIGGIDINSITSSGYTSRKFTKTDQLIIYPTIDFNGTIIISVKLNDGSTYGYDIISTKRSWYVQKNILQETEDARNGLSWNLYGKGFSVLVYKNTIDQLNEFSQESNTIKTSINFEDDSAKTFIEDAQVWFNNHKTRTGVNLKIYGVYPDINNVLSKSKYDLIALYRNDPSVVYWGGLFSTYSNFTQWEYHPGMMPNEVYILRQNFLNTSFVSDGNENLLNLISQNEDITYAEAEERTNPFNQLVDSLTHKNTNIVKYLPAYVEIVEEDFISLYNLKTNINQSKQVSVKDLFKWANENPISLKQTVLYYRVAGDLENSSLFYNISRDTSAIINYDDNSSEQSVTITSSNYFKIEEQNGSYSLNCYDMFSNSISFPILNSYRLPYDYLPSDDIFDIIDLTDSEHIETTIDPTNTGKIGDELTNTGNAYIYPTNEVNEFGPMSSLEIDPKKIINNVNDLANIINRDQIFEEMITPPDSTYGRVLYSGSALDITSMGRINASKKNPIGDENITPELMQ